MLKIIPVLLVSAMIPGFQSDAEIHESPVTAPDSIILAEETAAPCLISNEDDTYSLMQIYATNYITEGLSYSNEDLELFDREDRVESDINAFDHDGKYFTGTIIFQDGCGSGTISDEWDNNIAIDVIFKEEGQILTADQNGRLYQIELLNYRVIDPVPGE